jgi:pilus assembly protein Flp/PilA
MEPSRRLATIGAENKTAGKSDANKNLGRVLTMFAMITSVLQNKKGQGMVEYGLILALVAVVGMGALALLGPQVSAQFTNISNSL